MQSYSGAPPQDCRYRVSYEANWQWDMAMYLIYAQIDVFEGGRQVGSAICDARRGGANMGKSGATAEKIEPLVAELFG